MGEGLYNWGEVLMSPEIINLIKQIKHPLPSHCARQLPPRGSLAELSHWSLMSLLAVNPMSVSSDFTRSA